MTWQDLILGSASQKDQDDFLVVIRELTKRCEEFAAALKQLQLSKEPDATNKLESLVRELVNIPRTQAMASITCLAPLGVRRITFQTCRKWDICCDDVQQIEGDSERRIAALQTGLDALIGDLNGIRLIAIHNRQLRSTGLRGIVFVAAVATAITGIWLNFRHGFEPISRVIAFPQGPFATPPTGCDLTTQPERLQEYIEDFSELYFHSTGKFPYRFWENRPEMVVGEVAPDPLSVTRAPIWKVNSQPHTVRLRTTIQNKSIWNVEPISNVTLRVRLVKLDRFPWKKLDDWPAVECEFGNEEAGLIIANAGTGPALGLTCSVISSGGEKLREIHLGILDTGPVVLPRRISTTNLFLRELTCAGPDLKGGFLSKLVIRREQGDWELSSAVPIELMKDDGTPERQDIATLARLKEVADVIQGGRATIRIEYNSVKGQRFRHGIDIDLPSNVVFYRFKPESEVRKAECAAPAPTGLFFLAAAINGPSTTQEGGEAIINLKSKIELKSVKLGGAREETCTIEKRLSARGVVNWELMFSDPANGIYEVTCLVNETEVDTFRIFFLRPEHLIFPKYAEQDREIERIRDAVKRASAK